MITTMILSFAFGYLGTFFGVLICEKFKMKRLASFIIMTGSSFGAMFGILISIGLGG